MTTFELPAADAPASEWGAFAVSIPDWRWPDGMHDAAPGFVQSRYGIGSTGDVIPYAAEVAQTPVVVCYPDPDHWAWEGWLRRMLGETLVCVAKEGRGWAAIVDGETVTIEGYGTTPGRAAITAAVALGKWPGGGE